jgi:hypothetical protein
MSAQCPFWSEAEVQVEQNYYLKYLHDFRYEGGAPINSGFEIPLISHKYKNSPSTQARTT